MTDPTAAPIPNPDSFLCPGCGYSLFGIQHSSKCPECGLEIDRSVQGESRLPWVHRRKIGRTRAFLSTAWMSTFNTKVIGSEMNRPVSYSDARKFRFLCILAAWVPMFAWGIGVLCVLEVSAPAWQWICAVFAIGIAIWVYLLAMTGLPSLFFAPRDIPMLRQNRAVALSFYAAGPLVWTIFPAGTYAVLAIVGEANPDWERNSYLFLPFNLVPFALALFWFIMLVSRPGRLMKSSLQGSTVRRVALGITIPTAWIASFYVIVGGILLLAFSILVMIQSLRN